jgi:hypothetical protein
MDEGRGLTRRQFLGSTVLFAVAAAVGGRAAAAPANGAAAPANGARPAGKPRPPGTCGGWADGDGNGICDRSENGPKPCGAARCPGHKAHPARAGLKAKGAPEGACAQWADPSKAGFCAVSGRPDSPCVWVACPAHKKTTAAKAAAKPA